MIFYDFSRLQGIRVLVSLAIGDNGGPGGGLSFQVNLIVPQIIMTVLLSVNLCTKNIMAATEKNSTLATRVVLFSFQQLTLLKTAKRMKVEN